MDFKPEDDALMDENGALDVDASPRAPLPNLKFAITSGYASSSLSSKKSKCHGFHEDPNADRNSCLVGADFDSLKSSDGLESQQLQYSLPPSISFILLSLVTL